MQRYRGHISRQTIKDVSFVGPSDNAVAAGSDDGRMFLWDRCTGALFLHPFDPTHICQATLLSQSLAD